jgi:pyruvate dehydrogenase E1 component beta subunit
MVLHSLAAAEALAKEGVSVEVIDPRTLAPLDMETILQSVAKTGRLVVVDEGREPCSAASEISAAVAQHGFRSLKAPIGRVTAPNVPIPFSPPLENAVIPNPDRIIKAIQKVVDY